MGKKHRNIAIEGHAYLEWLLDLLEKATSDAGITDPDDTRMRFVSILRAIMHDGHPELVLCLADVLIAYSGKNHTGAEWSELTQYLTNLQGSRRTAMQYVEQQNAESN